TRMRIVMRLPWRAIERQALSMCRLDRPAGDTKIPRVVPAAGRRYGTGCVMDNRATPGGARCQSLRLEGCRLPEPPSSGTEWLNNKRRAEESRLVPKSRIR